MAKKKKEEEMTTVSEKKTEKPESEFDGRVGVIDKDAVEEAKNKFEKYQAAKAPLEERIKSNQNWFKGRYATNQKADSGVIEPDAKSAWAFNSIINKHADAMDNIPTANILPREESDVRAAETLSKVVPLTMEKCHFQKKYYDVWFDKLIAGGGIYKAYWDNSMSNGLGDINIIKIDPLNLFWEPEIEDIQDSESVFHLEYVKNKTIKENYPFMDGKLTDNAMGEIASYDNAEAQNREHSDESVVFDWWYKKTNGTKTVVHLCKFCNGEVLWASENTKQYKETGYYDHGRYPFVFDTLFPIKGTPFGFGYVDVMKSPQFVIDQLDDSIVKYAKMAGKPRWFKKKSSNVDVNQYADWSNDFVEVDGGNLDDNLRQIQLGSFPPFISNHWLNKIDELKETSGNRDFSQGATSAGVTAASAIAALQEAGSKLSRDMIKTSYWAYEDIIAFVVELMRQFYTEDRYFRIEAPNGTESFVAFSNQDIRPVETPIINADGSSDIAVRIPEFDYKIIAQKMSPFQRESQNQLAIQLYQLGVFNPQQADQVMPFLDMMQFEGIDKIKKTVSQNGMMYQQLLAMINLATEMAQILDAGDVLAGGQGQYMQRIMAICNEGNPAGGIPGRAQEGLGGAQGMPATESTVTAKARQRVASGSAPR